MALQRFDIANERLALQLSRADVEAHLKKVEGQRVMLADQLAAIDLRLEELARLEDTSAGQRMQQSMYTAIHADSRAVRNQRRLEQQTFNDWMVSNQRRLEQQALDDRIVRNQRRLEQQTLDDRIVAAAIGRAARRIPGSARQQLSGRNFGDEPLTQPRKAGSDEEVEDDAHQVTLSRRTNALRLDESPPLIDCAVCTASFLPSQTVTLRCDHTWCCGCMSQRYQEATVNEGAWPVKCCRIEIPVESVSHLLSLDQRTRFAIKATEWADTNRTYCHEPSCSTYIPHSSITDRRAPCPTCQRTTCAECKVAYHPLPPCPEGTRNDNLLAETARVNRWPRCPGCNRYVEISSGCNHITCRCRTEFCYECSRVWKQCRCSQWRAEHLFERANQVAGRQGRADVGRVAREVVRRHDCDHRIWTQHKGSRVCDECRQTLRDCLWWHCQGCHLRFCNRCRFTRLRIG